ncbi:MAG: hypothetical protein ABSF87_06935 [Xanthobacteraceae bacterium]|jgi:hypothetical protein
MAHDSEHLKKLTDARDRVVAERRQISDALAQEYKHGHSVEMRERFISIQNTIEAIDRAIADERRITSGDNSVPPGGA